jgi:hypothetical protein
VWLSANSIGRLPAQLGITPRKPLWRAYWQNPELLRKWVEEEYSSIAKEDGRMKAETWFGDESGVQSDYHAGTTWGRKRQTRLALITDTRYWLNMLSAVNRRGLIRFMRDERELSAAVVCRFLDRLVAASLTLVFLMWDGHPGHIFRKVAKAVRRYQGRLRVYVFSGYSPELNPDGCLWREVKAHRMGRASVFTLAHMKSEALGALRHVTRRPDKFCCSFVPIHPLCRVTGCLDYYGLINSKQ